MNATALQRRFAEFDSKNPKVWELFCRFADEAIKAGHTILSASLIAERIRWETEVITTSGDGFKLNNNHRAYYARKFNQLRAQAGVLFRLRKVHRSFNQSSVPYIP